MTLLQSIQGPLSEDYTLTLAFGVIGFLLVAIAGVVGNYFVSTLKEIKDEVKVHGNEIHDLKMDTAIIKQSIGRSTQDLAEEIYMKIKSITPQ